MHVLGLRVVVSLIALSASVCAQVTRRVSVDSNGAQGDANSVYTSTSADGRYVAFESVATNLVSGDTNGASDVFVRDLQVGTTERVSVDSGGAQGNNFSFRPSISADGRYVAFQSSASNLVPGDTNGSSDIFVRDRQSGTTERVSLDSGGVQGDSISLGPSISADGRYVAFYGYATNLVPGDTNGFQDVFVRDRQGATTERASVDSGGAQGNHDSGSPTTLFNPSISADGRYVAFESLASNLVPGDTNGFQDIFVRDRQGGTTERVSIDSGGAQTFGTNTDTSISADGRYVAFVSDASNLVPGDTNGANDIFVRDRQSGTTERVSLDSGGAQGNGSSLVPSISSDGRYVAFESVASNLVSGDTNGFKDVFVRDRQSGTTERVSLDSGGGQGNGASGFASISQDGRYVAFDSNASNLVPGDTNAFSDVFVHESGGGTDAESTGTGGAPGNGDSFGPSLSPDARYLAFESNATNLVAVDANSSKDVFLRDREVETNALASVDSSGAQANGTSAHPSVSADGRYVAFDSVATNLVAGDTNGAADVFVHDFVANTTARVSVDSVAAQGNGASLRPSISADGRYVAFESGATNLVASDTNGTLDVFRHDRQTGTTARVSVDSGGAQGTGASGDPDISDDGRYVAFESTAANLVPQDGNAASDIFVRDLVGNATSRWSVNTAGVEGNGASTNAAMSGDGGQVGFQSDASNLVTGDTNLSTDAFVRQGPGAGSLTRRVSQDPGGTQGLGNSTDPSVSADGRHVSYSSDASNLVSGDTNGVVDVFVNDRLTGINRRVSVDSGGTQGTNASGGASISADGRFVAFDSFASNLAPGDTNGFEDVFLRDEGTAAAFEAFCFGDGSGTACPCSNSGATGHGCENSGTTGGAILTATGEASLADDTVQFTSSGEKPTAFSIFLQGTAAIAPLNYGDGLRCTGGSLKRLYTKNAVGGVVSAPLSGDPSVTARSAALGAPIPLGATREYQVYYRDSVAGFCASPQGSTFNISSGIIVAWGG